MTGKSSLSRRLDRLERRQVRITAAGTTTSSARARLEAHLDTLAERVRAGGELTDDLHLSPVERLVRAWERGDGPTACEILSRAVGRALP